MGDPFDAAWAILKGTPYDTPEDLQNQGLNLPHSTTADEDNPYLDDMQAKKDQEQRAAEERQRMMALQTTPAPDSPLPPGVEEYLRQMRQQQQQ